MVTSDASETCDGILTRLAVPVGLDEDGQRFIHVLVNFMFEDPGYVAVADSLGFWWILLVMVLHHDARVIGLLVWLVDVEEEGVNGEAVYIHDLNGALGHFFLAVGKSPHVTRRCRRLPKSNEVLTLGMVVSEQPVHRLEASVQKSPSSE